jgi:hypothetical protein
MPLEHVTPAVACALALGGLAPVRARRRIRFATHEATLQKLAFCAPERMSAEFAALARGVGVGTVGAPRALLPLCSLFHERRLMNSSHVVPFVSVMFLSTAAGCSHQTTPATSSAQLAHPAIGFAMKGPRAEKAPALPEPRDRDTPIIDAMHGFNHTSPR